MDSSLTYALLGAVFLFLVFLFLRELMCWYWKINEIVSLQRQILAALTRSTPPENAATHGVNERGSAAEEYAAGRITKAQYESAVRR